MSIIVIFEASRAGHLTRSFYYFPWVNISSRLPVFVEHSENMCGLMIVDTHHTLLHRSNDVEARHGASHPCTSFFAKSSVGDANMRLYIPKQ